MYNSKEFQKTFLGNTAAVASLIGGTAQIFTGRGTFHGVIVGTTTGTAFAVSDSTGLTGITFSNGSTAMILKASIAERLYEADMIIANGLYVSFGVNGTYTVLWSQ